MNSISAKNSRFSSTLSLALILLLTLTSTWLLSLRPVRLKIGDYYHNQGKFDQAANWYERIVRKGKLKINQGRDDLTKYEEDLCKLKTSTIRVMEEKILTVSRLLGFEESQNLRSLMTNPKFFLKEINLLVDDALTEKLLKAKEKLEYSDILNNLKDLYKNKSDRMQLDYLISIGYFFKGIIDEFENKFISVDSIYEKTTTFYPPISGYLNERRKKILPAAAEEYFSRSPSIKKVVNVNVLLESESPLVISGVVSGRPNFLEYEICPVRFIMQKYSTTKLRIQGEVLGQIKKSSIVPRVVFWGDGQYLGEVDPKIEIIEKFDISFPFSVPNGTTGVMPRIVFDNDCFSKGQKIFIREVKWH